MILSLIVAMGTQRQIGLNNQLPWHIPEDLKNFKSLTMGHHLLMGRKTFESIGRPLPGRTSIVLTRQKDYAPAGCLVVSSVNQALELAKKRGEQELFVCGGAQVYTHTIIQADRLYWGRVDYSGPADTFFPPFEHLSWEYSSLKKYPELNNSPAWSFQVLERHQ